MNKLDSSREYSQDYLLLKMLVGFGNKLGTIDRMTFGELTGRQCALIASIGAFDKPPTLGYLAECEGSSHQNIKQMALKLQERGYVSLLSDSGDARKIRVASTEKGDSFCVQHQEKAQRFLELLLKDVAEVNIDSASQAIDTMNENLDKMIACRLKLS